MKRAQLLEKSKEITTSPGVYLMKDGKGTILYVGKAKRLRSRVSSYFKAQKHESPRTEMLVDHIDDFDLILTETEAEALILECTLIKRHRPKFNVRLKDDKAYPYIKIQTEEDFPRLEWTRRVKKDKALYFGPFPSAWSAKQVMFLLNETLKLRDCSDNTFRHRSRPCILYQIGRCTAPCVGKISQSEYKEQIEEAIAVLQGKGTHLEKWLKEEMQKASDSQEYELAAHYRDQLQNLEIVTETQGVLEPGADRARDVVGLAREGSDAEGVILQIRSGKLLAVRHYLLQNTDQDLSDSEILFEFLAQFYEGSATVENQTTHPEEVLLPLAPEDPELLEKTFSVTVRVAENETDEQLLSVAKRNAQHALELKSKKEKGHGLMALEEIRKKLHLDRTPHRIECYDISNIQGDDAVASRVVFINGEADKNLYRRYKIRTVEGSNDFAMMKEVLSRRFLNKSEDLPDLVVVDGGKGQLSQAIAIFEELEIQGVDVVGLAKARVKRDFKAKEVKASSERVFLPNRKNPVMLYPHTASFQLLTHVRDEAHRFAIQYHRNVRSKRTLGGKKSR